MAIITILLQITASLKNHVAIFAIHDPIIIMTAHLQIVRIAMGSSTLCWILAKLFELVADGTWIGLERPMVVIFQLHLQVDLIAVFSILLARFLH